jgi:penicillin-binding protein 1C
MKFQIKNIFSKKNLIIAVKPFAVIMLLFLVLNLIFPLKTNIEYSKTISDLNNEILHAYLTADDKWRMYTELDEISSELKKAIIFKEDKYFYWHFGVNPIAIARAFTNNVLKQKRTSGASTITMQVIRLLKPKKRTYLNKFLEIFNAFQLEWKYSKDEIFQMYLNLVPYGSNIEGVKSASVLYLDKQPNHLSLAEITALSIIPNRPTSLMPGKNNELIVQERNKWLKRFLKHQVFEKEIIEDALTEGFNVKRLSSPKKAPHFSYRMKNKFSEKINIRTTLNQSIQQKTEAIATNFMRTYGAQNIHNTSIMVIDNKTMNVVAYVGSNDFFDNEHAGQVDGVNAVRQPGSTLKPLLYGIAIDEGLLTPKTIITDVPINYGGYAPVNYNKEYNGYVSIEDALANSLNVPAVKVLQKLGVDALTDKLIQTNFNTIDRQKKYLGLSVVLGGCGVTLQELTTLYSSFANNGKFQALNWLQYQEKQTGDTINQQILSPKSTFMISEMMTNLQRPDLPGYWQNTKNLPKIAWKTGTSYGRKDAWSIGFNDKYTVGIWVGNFSGEGVPEMTGSKNATPILFNVFKSIDSEHSKSWLKKPKDLDIRLVCAESGQIPSERCTNEIFDYFIPGVSDNLACTHLSRVYIAANDSFTYCMDCRPSTGYKTKWLPNHSPEIIAFYENENIGYEKLPTHNPKCEHIHKEGAPIITAPKDGTTYYIDNAYPEEVQLRCQANKDATEVFWYVNDVFYKSGSKNEDFFFKPKQGQNKISCSDDLGRNTNIWFDVEFVDI